APLLLDAALDLLPLAGGAIGVRHGLDPPHVDVRKDSSKPQALPSSGRDLQRHRVGFRIEEDAGLPTLELVAHLRDLLLQGVLALAVVGAFAQHEGLDHPLQRFRRQLAVRNEKRPGQRLRTLLSRRRISRYSHTSVTMRPNAEYHSMYLGAPPATP